MRHSLTPATLPIPRLTLWILLGGLWLSALPVLAGWEEGRNHLAQGRFEEAAREFQAVTETHPEWANGYFMLGQALNQLDRPTEALAALRRAHELEPEEAQFAFLLGRLYAATGRFEDADRVLEKVQPETLSQRHRASFFQTRAVVATQLEETESALEFWNRTLALEPQNPEAQYDYGVLLLTAQRWAEAVAALEAAVKGSSDPPAKHLRKLALTLSATEAHSRAMAIAERLVAVEPSYGSLALLGEAQFESQRYEAANTTFSQAAKLDPKAWRPHYYLGRIRFSGGDPEAAEAALRLAAERVPPEDAHTVWSHLALTYSRQERYQEAARAYAEAGDEDGVARALENRKIQLHNLQAEKEEQELEEIRKREAAIQVEINEILNGRKPR